MESSRHFDHSGRHASCSRSPIMKLRGLHSILWLLLLAPAVAHAQTPKPVPFPGESLVGKDSFEAYCASCHGTDGRGNGPVAASLRNIPTDLTVLASRNADSYPRERVTAVLMGTSRTVVCTRYARDADLGPDVPHVRVGRHVPRFASTISSRISRGCRSCRARPSTSARTCFASTAPPAMASMAAAPVRWPVNCVACHRV